jgi:hypothetical protein
MKILKKAISFTYILHLILYIELKIRIFLIEYFLLEIFIEDFAYLKKNKNYLSRKIQQISFLMKIKIYN